LSKSKWTSFSAATLEYSLGLGRVPGAGAGVAGVTGVAGRAEAAGADGAGAGVTATGPVGAGADATVVAARFGQPARSGTSINIGTTIITDLERVRMALSPLMSASPNGTPRGVPLRARPIRSRALDAAGPITAVGAEPPW
jgi:hypothetical protein